MITIRKLGNNDYSEYLYLINQFRKTNFSNNEFIDTLIKIQLSSEIWVIEKDNKLIGTGTIIYEHKFIHNLAIYAHIEDICIDNNMRNDGYGKILINHLIGRAEEKGCKKITVTCSEYVSGFYKKCLFEENGIQMTYMIDK